MSTEPRDELSCAMCKLLFTSLSDVRVHEWQVHDRSPTTKCETCISGFTTEEDVMNHVRMHYLYYCNLCSLNTNSWTYYREHVCHKVDPDVLTWNNAEKEDKFSTCLDGVDIAAETHLTEENSERFKEFNSEWKIGENEEQTSNDNFMPKKEMLLGHAKNRKKLLTCEVCSKTFKYQSDLKRHLVVHSGERPHFCSFCKKRFSSDAYRKKHIRRVHDKIANKSSKPKVYVCHVCSKAFTYKSMLEDHLLSHNGEKTHICHVCKKGFLRDRDLKRHIGRIHGETGEKPHVCNVCKTSFMYKDHLDEHLVVHIDERQYHCHVCTKTFRYKSDFERHLPVHSAKSKKPREKLHICPFCKKRYSSDGHRKRHIRRFHDENANKSSTPKAHVCHVCSKAFTYKSILEDHLVYHTGEKICPFCKKRFRSDAHRKRHIRRVHDENANKSSKPKAHVCHVCSKAFTYKFILEDHLLSHNGEKTHICHVCKKGFLRDRDLKRHIGRIHDEPGEKPHVCHVCSKAFTYKFILEDHLHVHSAKSKNPREKRHICLVCQKGFNEIKRLQLHISRVHDKNAKKSFTCHVCSKAFFIKCHLKNHLRVHTGEKSHLCHVCGKAFTIKYNLTRHLFVHTDKKAHLCPKPHVCHICRKAFRLKNSLKRHLLVHPDERSHVCHVCNEGFNEAEQMNQHITLVHENIEKLGILKSVFPC